MSKKKYIIIILFVFVILLSIILIFFDIIKTQTTLFKEGRSANQTPEQFSLNDEINQEDSLTLGIYNIIGRVTEAEEDFIIIKAITHEGEVENKIFITPETKIIKLMPGDFAPKEISISEIRKGDEISALSSEPVNDKTEFIATRIIVIK